MCGRFSLSAPADELSSIFGVDVSGLAPRFNVAPSQKVATVRVDARSGRRRLAELRWGLIPGWAKDPAIGNRLINARAETLGEKASFRAAFAARRCLVLADGFFEWQKQGKRKQPFYVHMRDGRPFAMAGLWERWTKGPEPIESCAIVTTESNGVVAPIHGRMPVILHPSDWGAWLDPEIAESELLQDLLRPFPADGMTAHAVGTVVNNPKNDTPACVEPVASGDLFL